MQFRRSGQREDRRRRALADERTAGANDSTSSAGADSSTSDDDKGAGSRNARAYSDQAHPERQARVIDFVPTRAWMIALLLLVGSVVLGGILALYAYLGMPREPFTAEELAPFHLASRGSLASWYSAWLLAGAACGATLLYSLRRHRVDDYRGYYRIWLWAGALLMLASIDSVTGLHLTMRRLLVVTSGTTLHASGDLWWIAVLGALYAVLGIRLLFEVKASRGTFAAILLAGAAYGLAIAARFGAVTQFDVAQQWPPVAITMIQHGAVMAGHLFVVLAVGVNLRYVLLDIQGLIPPRAERPRKQPKKKRVAKTTTTGEKGAAASTRRKRSTRRSDLEPAAETESKAKTSSAKASNKLRRAVADGNAKNDRDDALDTVAEEAREIGMDPAAYSSLSKSERRRLRKQHRRSSRRAA